MPTTDPIITVIQFVSTSWPAILGAAIGGGIYLLQRTTITKHLSVPQFRAKQAKRSSQPPRYKKDVYILLQGNREQAERIVAFLRQQNPGKSEKWLWEKAALDIVRDRRA